MSATIRLMFISFVALLAFLFLANQDFSQGAISLAARKDVAAAKADLTAPDQGSLIVNGSFELASVDPCPSFIALPGGDTRITGWAVLPVNIHYVCANYWKASNGSRSLDLDGTIGAAGGIEQTFRTTPGTRYAVSFDLAGNPESGPTVKSMRVSADGQSAVFNFDITGKSVMDMGWRRETWTFTADDSLATLQFVSLNGSGWGPALDNVSVQDPLAPQICVPPPTGLVSRWAAEGNANDLSGSNHGQLEGGAGYAAAGKVGKAFSFDGTGVVRVAHNANLNVQAFTIEAWVYPALLDGVGDTIVCKETDAPAYQYYLVIRGPDNRHGAGTIPRGNLAFYLHGITGLPTNEFPGGTVVDGGGQVPLFTWTHVALTFDGGSAKTYINGVLTRNITGLSGMINATSGPFRIGSRSDSVIRGSNPQDGFNGLIDEVALYNRAFSASEIQSIFNAGELGKCSVANVSAASFLGQSLAGDSIVAAFGTDLATETRSAPPDADPNTPGIQLPTELGGTRVEVGGKRAGLFFVSPKQINFHMPPSTATGPASVAITNRNSLASYGASQIASVAPGLFSANSDGQGVAAAVAVRVKPNGDQITEPVSRFDSGQNKHVAVPIDLGPATDQMFLIPFGTGFRFRSSLSAVTVRVGGMNSEVSFAGETPGFIGLDQVNVRLSRDLIGRGDVDVVLTVDGKTANTVRVNIK